MSRFYYSGSLEQVNYLSQKDVFLQFLYGNWISMLLEGISFIVYAIIISVMELIQYFEYLNFPEAYVAYGFVILCLLLALIFFSTYMWSKKFEIVTILKQRTILDLVIALILFLFPFFLNGLTGFGSFILGLYFFENKKKPRKILGLVIMIIGILLIFNFSFTFNYINWLYVILLVGFGVFLIQLAFKFRSSIKKFYDEQKGFTDYTIE